MATMSFAENILEHSLVYRAWQMPFAGQKFAPILAHNPLQLVRRVLDVGCGPGTNTSHFSRADYLGVDINERYIEDARRRHGRNFLAADVRNFSAAPADRFDFVLVNSFLHHLNTHDVVLVLTHLRSLLTEDGHIHILELVLPDKPCIASSLARRDRGKFARPLDEWRRIFDELFEPVVFESYRLTGMGATLWNMVYFKGRLRA
jgi:SAM-dependent methyltransferase